MQAAISKFAVGRFLPHGGTILSRWVGNIQDKKQDKPCAGVALVINNEPPRYRAFMLRCWEVRSPGPGGAATWRFSVEDPHTGQRLGFADLATLVEFLQAELSGEDGTLRR